MSLNSMDSEQNVLSPVTTDGAAFEELQVDISKHGSFDSNAKDPLDTSNVYEEFLIRKAPPTGMCSNPFEKSGTKEEKVCCPTCNEYFDSGQLPLHSETAHGKMNLFSLPPQRLVHPQSKTRDSSNWACTDCKKNFPSVLYLSQHRAICTANHSNQLRCNICKTEIDKETTNLQSHYEQFHKESCPYCFFNFTSRAGVYTHQAKVHNIPWPSEESYGPKKINVIVKKTTNPTDNMTVPFPRISKKTSTPKTNSISHKISQNVPSMIIPDLMTDVEINENKTVSDQLGLDVTIYQCSHCVYQSTSKSMVKLHLVQEHPELTIEPNGEGQIADEPIENGTILSSLDSTVYQCIHCSYQNTSEAVVQLHLRQHTEATEHLQLSMNETILPDTNTECDVDTSGLLNETENIVALSEVSNVIYQCVHCNYKNISPTAMQIHLECHTNTTEQPYHSKSDQISIKLKIAKLICSELHNLQFDPFASKPGLHLGKHSEHLCRLCGRQSISQVDHEIHIVSHLLKYQCQSCSSQIIPPENIGLQYLLHNTNNWSNIASGGCETLTYKCVYCGYDLKTVNSTDGHYIYFSSRIQPAMEAQTYKCHYCSMTLSNRMELGNHQWKEHINVRKRRFSDLNVITLD